MSGFERFLFWLPAIVTVAIFLGAMLPMFRRRPRDEADQ